MAGKMGFNPFYRRPLTVPPKAKEVPYDNDTSGLISEDVQEAIDELKILSGGGGGGIIIPVMPAVSPYSANNSELVAVDASSGPFTINLPSAAITAQRIIVKKLDNVNDVIVTAAGAELIDGDGVYILKFQYESITLISNGIQWLIV